MVFFRFKSGCTALLDANRYNEPLYEKNRYTFGEMWIEGSQGSLALHPDGKIYVKLLDQPLEKLSFKPSALGFAGDSVYNCQNHFIDGLTQNIPFETSIDDYLKTLQVVEAIYQSHLEERNVSLPKLNLKQWS